MKKEKKKEEDLLEELRIQKEREILEQKAKIEEEKRREELLLRKIENERIINSYSVMSKPRSTKPKNKIIININEPRPIVKSYAEQKLSERQESINKYNEEEVKLYSSRNNPSYQITRKYAHKEFPTGYENAKHISKKMDYGDPNSKYGKISSRSEKYYAFYTESSSPKVNFNSKNTSKKYKNKRSITPGRNVKNNNFESKSHNNLINNDYISELREEYSNPILNNRVNIRKKVYRGSKTPQPYRTNEYQGNNEEEELLENYGYHETKNIKDKGHKKYESITHITGYSNLIPLNRLKQCGRIESYNYNELNEQENKPKLINAIERVRELQKGKREYDEFMRKLGSADEDEDKIENYKREQMRQHEIREEKIKIERMRQERIKEEQIKRDKLREQKLREEQMRNERIRQEKIRMERKRKEDELMKAKKFP